MTAILLALFSALANILPGTLGTYFQTKRDIELTNAKTMQMIAEAKQQMSAEMAKADSERAIVALNSTGHAFKYVVFVILSVPYLLCLVNQPQYAQNVFVNLNTLPSWYNVIYTAIIAVIWGIPVPGSIMENVFQGISNGIHNRRVYKISSTLAKQGIDTAALFSSLRKSIFTKGLSQDQVDAINVALKAAGADVSSNTNDEPNEGKDDANI